MNMIEILFKPQFRKSFQFVEIFSVTFVADKIKDTLDLFGVGQTVDGGLPVERKQMQLKLSEHPAEMKTFMSFIGKLKTKEIHSCTTKIDFEKKIIQSSIFHINLDGEATETELETKF